MDKKIKTSSNQGGDKYFLKSKTIIGALLTIFATLAPEFVTVEEADSMAQLIIQIIGLSIVIYGRFNATEKLKM